jgi:hypothetical protein
MMIFCNSGCRVQLHWRVQAWALERLISFNGASGDIRLAILLLAVRLSTAMWAFGQRRFLRVGPGRQDADSTVAAAGS